MASSDALPIYIILLISPPCYQNHRSIPIHSASTAKTPDCASMKSRVLSDSTPANASPNGKMVIQFLPSGAYSSSPFSTECHPISSMTRCISLSRILPLPRLRLLRRLVFRWHRRDIPRHGFDDNGPKRIPFRFEVNIPLLMVDHIQN